MNQPEAEKLKEKNIEEILKFPGFSIYTGERKEELLNILQNTNLSIGQLDLLFNSDSVSGGIIANLVEQSAQTGNAADEPAKLLGKFIWNIKEKKHESFPPDHIINTTIQKLGPCGEQEIEDIQNLITRFVAVHKGRIIQPPLTQTDSAISASIGDGSKIKAAATLFRTTDSAINKVHDMVSALTLLRLAGIDKPENVKIIKEKEKYLPGIIRVLNNLNQLQILSQSNFDKVMQLTPQNQSLALLGMALDRLMREGLLNNENGQLYFEKLLQNATLLSGKDFLRQLDLYTNEIKNNPKVLGNK